MTDAELLLHWFVIGLAWICALDFLAAVVLLIIYTWKEPPHWWVRRRLPDYYDPHDWSPKGADAKANRP